MFMAWTLLPNFYGGAAASLLLPFALVNSVVAGAAYGAADVVVAAVGVGVGGGTSGNNLAIRMMDAPPVRTDVRRCTRWKACCCRFNPS